MNLQTTEQKVIQLKKNKNNGNRIEQTQERWHQIDNKFCPLERGETIWEKKTKDFYERKIRFRKGKSYSFW